MEVQGLETPSLLSLVCGTPAGCFKNSRKWPVEHCLTMEKQSEPQRWVWSDVHSCRACCFPWACGLRVLLILLLHFLLHLPAHHAPSQARCLGRAAGRSRQARPRLFQQSHRPTEWRRRQQTSELGSITH